MILGKAAGKALGLIHGKAVKGHLFPCRKSVGAAVKAPQLVVVPDDGRAGVGQLVGGVRQQHGGETHFRFGIHQIFGDGFVFNKAPVRHNNDIMGQQLGVVVFLVRLTFKTLSYKSGEKIHNVAHGGSVAAQKPQLAVGRPYMGQIPDVIPLVGFLGRIGRAHTKVCVGVGGGKLHGQRPRQIEGPLPVPADYAHKAVIVQRQRHGD